MCYARRPGRSCPFRRPGEDWAAIEHRVNTAISLDGISHQVSQHPSGFEALARVCMAWRAQSQPDINESARSLVRYCGVAITQFEQLRTAACGGDRPRGRGSADLAIEARRLGLPLRSTLPPGAIASLLGPMADATLPKYLRGVLR